MKKETSSMNRLKQKALDLSLEHKLIAAFSCFIIVPLILIGGIVSWVYVDNNRTTMIDAAVENNKQIVKNIDTSLQPLKAERIAIGNGHLSISVEREAGGASFSVKVLENTTGYALVG